MRAPVDTPVTTSKRGRSPVSDQPTRTPAPKAPSARPPERASTFSSGLTATKSGSCELMGWPVASKSSTAPTGVSVRTSSSSRGRAAAQAASTSASAAITACRQGAAINRKALFFIFTLLHRANDAIRLFYDDSRSGDSRMPTKIWLSGPICALFSMILVPVAEAKPVTNYTHYLIAGESAEGLYRSMLRKGPHVGGGKAYASTKMIPEVSAKTV